MQNLLQSASLQALGYAIFNSLWQVALLWMVVMIINNAFKLTSSGKYVTGVIAQFGAFVWFIFTFRFYYVQCSEAIASARSSGMGGNMYAFYEPAVTDFSSGLMYTIIKTEQLLPYLSIAYMVMLIFLAIRLVRAWIYTKNIRNQGLIKPGIDLKLFVKRTAGYLGIHKEVLLYFSELVKSPLTLGFAKPIILVPLASLNHLTTDQLEAILLHELAHIKRADYLINIILSVIEVILFFNPFTQLIGRLIKKERENSCDDWVLQFQYKPAMYAEALLRIASIQVQPSFAMQAAGTKGELLPRVKRMLNQQEKTHYYRNHVFALMLITIMLTTVAWFNPGIGTKPVAATASATTEDKKLMIEPFTANVDNPFYNLAYLLTKPLRQNLEKSVKQVSEEVIAATVPKVEDAVNKVTPIAMESFGNAFNEITEALPKMGADIRQAMQEAKAEMDKISINGVSISDSAAIAASITNLVQKELAKIDIGTLKTDLEKTGININTTLSAIQAQVAQEPNINDAAEQASQQLRSLKAQKDIIINTNFLKELFLQKNDAARQQELKLLQEKSKKEHEKASHNTPVVYAPRRLKVWSDMQRDDYSLQFDAPEFNAAATPMASQGPQTYEPSTEAYNYNSNQHYTATTASFNESCADSLDTDAGIIIFQHSPDNDKSYNKNITISIISSNGIAKTYKIKVTVSQ